MSTSSPNQALERTGLSLWVWPWSFWFAHISGPVAQLGRSGREGTMALPIIISIFGAAAGLAFWLHLYVQRTPRHQLRALSESSCPACGINYGPEIAEGARREYLARCDDARKQHPHLKINFVRFWDIRCPRCGQEARFHYETESLDTHAAEPTGSS